MMNGEGRWWCTGLPTNLKDIDIFADDLPTDGLPDPAPESMTDVFDIFLENFMPYSQLWVRWPSIRMSVPSIPNMRLLTSHHMIPWPLHPSSRDASTFWGKAWAPLLWISSKRHIQFVSFEEYFISVDVFYFIWEAIFCI
jgi:hypothetical protein